MEITVIIDNYGNMWEETQTKLVKLVRDSYQSKLFVDPNSEYTKAVEYIGTYNDWDSVVLAYDGPHLVGTVTATPFESKFGNEMFKIIDSDGFSAIPNAPGVALHRLAGKNFLDSRIFIPVMDKLLNWGEENGLCPDPQSFVCGTTHSRVIQTLKNFLPITVLGGRFNEKAKTHNLSALFMQDVPEHLRLQFFYFMHTTYKETK